MGQAKIKQRAAFSEDLVAEWEADACVNFAVALARVTGWLLQVDWWNPGLDGKDEDIPIEQFKCLRVYVQDNGDNVFDVRGVRHYQTFADKTVFPMARQYGNGGVRTRFYSEEELETLPLKSMPDPAKIAAAMDSIKANPAYLALVSKRPESSMPAHIAATFTYGSCVPFAEALRESTGLPAAAMFAVRLANRTSLPDAADDGYFHSVVVHPARQAEDSWGRASTKEIANRFGVLDFELSEDRHREIVQTLKRNSPDNWALRYEEAKTAIAAFQS